MHFPLHAQERYPFHFRPFDMGCLCFYTLRTLTVFSITRSGNVNGVRIACRDVRLDPVSLALQESLNHGPRANAVWPPVPGMAGTVHSWAAGLIYR